MTFLHPEYLLLLLVVPALIAWYIWRGKDAHATLDIPSTSLLKGISGGLRVKLRHMPFILRISALILLIIAFARPQTMDSWVERDAEGIDIMMTMDISTSMLSMDFQPNRVEAAKRVAANFISSREHDNIGLVVFAGESFTACPLTTDHAALLNRLATMRPGIIEDRTAIGLGIVTAINRLRESKTPSKVIILLTDGSNNAGDIAPAMAADMAAAYGITIHTIGMGTLAGEAPMPVQSIFGDIRTRNVEVDIDETTLKQIADKTGGVYFRASDDTKLDQIYKEIDALEKTKLSTRQFNAIHEGYYLFVFGALLLLLLEFILRNTYLRTIP